jgi:hypothetical protein
MAAGRWGGALRIAGPQLAMNAAHQDQVIDPPEGAETLGGNDFTRHAVLAYGDHILTMQPHPEIEAGFMSYLLRLRGTHLSEELEAAIAELAPNDAKPSPTGSRRSCAARPSNAPWRLEPATA